MYLLSLVYHDCGTVARLGSEKFSVILEGIHASGQTVGVAERIIAAFK